MKKFIKFGLTGAVNSVLNYAVYIVCIQRGMHYIPANIIGFIIAVFHAYVLQNRFVFTKRKEDKGWKILLRTYAAYAFTGLLLANVLAVFWIDILDVGPLLSPLYLHLRKYYPWDSVEEFVKWTAPVLTMVVTVPINFVINRYWTYRERFS